jgi:hypothetical protein
VTGTPTTKRVALIGHGVVGSRIGRAVPVVLPGVELVQVDTRHASRAAAALAHIDAAILASTSPHAGVAQELLERQIPAISIGDELDDVAAMVELDRLALDVDVPFVVGAGMSPGLSGLLVRHLTSQLTTSDEIHIAIHGTAGPACARQHHRALSGNGLALHDGAWVRRPAGSGRELCWFPEPVGAYDCYRAELASPLLLRDLFPDVDRITARVSANRRDRLTAWLPMLSRPHPEGGVGALRVEVRGSDASGGRSTLVVGIAELVGTATAATTVAFLQAMLDQSLPAGVVCAGDGRLDTVSLLRTVERVGVRLQEFTGVPHPQIVASS